LKGGRGIIFEKQKFASPQDIPKVVQNKIYEIVLKYYGF